MRQTTYLAGALHDFWCFREKVLTPGRGCGILGVADIRRCGGMADTGDLKSPGSDTVPVRVRSPAPYRVFLTNLRVGWGHSISFCLHLCLFDMYEQEPSCSFLLCLLAGFTVTKTWFCRTVHSPCYTEPPTVRLFAWKCFHPSSSFEASYFYCPIRHYIF